MSEFRKFLFDKMQKTAEGKLPIKTAKEIHLTAHRVVMDRHADARLIELTGKADLCETVKKVLKS